MQSNQIMYSSERLLKFEGKKNLDDITVRPISQGEVKTPESEKTDSKAAAKRVASAKRPKTVEERLPAFYVRSRSAAKIREKERGIGGFVSQYNYLQKKEDPNSISYKTKSATGKSILRIIFVEKYDYIIGASEDKNIYIWSFDADALKALHALRDQSSEANPITDGRSIDI